MSTKLEKRKSSSVRKRIAVFRNAVVKVFVEDEIVPPYRSKRIRNIKE